MKAELKLQESEEMQEFLALKIQKDLEAKLIAELIEKLQHLEKKIIQEEGTKKVSEKTEEQEKTFFEYGLEIETAYSKDKSAYHTKSDYENKQ